MNQPRRGTSLRAKSIINRCRSGGYLHKVFAGKAVAYFVEPGAVRVAAEYALEAVRSGWLAPCSDSLFDDPDNSQCWIFAPPPPTPRQNKPQGVRR